MAKRTFSHIPSQPGDAPTVRVPSGAKGSRYPLQSPQVGFSSSFILGERDQKRGGGDTAPAPFPLPPCRGLSPSPAPGSPL